MTEQQLTFANLAKSGDITFGDGYRTKKSEHGKPGLPILRVAEVHDGTIKPEFADYVSDAYRTKMREKISQPGDVVLTTKGTVGRVAIIPTESPEFVYSPQVCFFRVTKGARLEPKYLYYWFRSSEFWSQASSRKSQTDMADYLNLSDISSLIITVPNRAQQQLVVDILRALDDKIVVNERIADNAEALGAALFERFFSEAIQHLVSCADLPEEWRVSDLGSTTEAIESGRRPKGGVAKYTSGVPSIGAESVIGLAKFDFSKVKYVPEDFFASLNRGLVQDLDILVYKDGGKPGDFKPHVSIFGKGFPFSRMCINEHVYRVRMKSELGQEFGYYWLSSPVIMDEMRRRGTGAAIPGINSTAVKGIPVVEPPADRLLQFRAAAASLVERALHAASESRTLARLRDTLLPQLMSGKLRVRDAEKIVEDAL